MNTNFFQLITYPEVRRRVEFLLEKGGEKKKASGSARETEDRGQITIQLLGRRARDSSREIFKAGKIVAVRGSYCVHRVRVGPQRKVEGGYTSL